MEYLRGALILSIASIVCCQKFIPVLASCRYWDELDIYSDIGDQRFHCILDQDKVPGIVYTEWTTIPSGYCPIYNRHAKEIDLRPCNNSIGKCPSKLIRSYQAVAYTGCFQMPLPRKPSYTDSAAEDLEDGVQINTVLMVLVLVLQVALVTLGLAMVYCYTRRNKRHTPTGCTDNRQSLVKTEKHTSERKTRCCCSLNNVYYRKNENHSAENRVNTAISRSSSEKKIGWHPMCPIEKKVTENHKLCPRSDVYAEND